MDRFFNSDVIAIIETDANFKIIRANEGAQLLLGYTVEELSQRTWIDLTHPDDIQKAVDHFEPLFKFGHAPCPILELRYKSKSGEIVHAAVNVHAGEQGPDGRPSYYVGYIINISDRIRAESHAQRSEVKLHELHRKIGQALGDALGTRDAYTARHQTFVAVLSDRIGINLGLARLDREATMAAAGVHDIGKIAIPIEYLTKTTKLEDLEFQVIRTHARRGYEILAPMETEFPVAEIVYQHHERLDGSGYPRGLKNGSILQGAQIIAAADTIDSMANSRPYRRALSKESVIETLTAERGIKLSADVVDASIKAFCEMP
jgi:PAS domain S-box-containing protein